MTRTEDRLRAVLAETADTVRENALRPLVVPERGPGRKPRRWPRTIAPIAAATAVAVLLAVEIALGQMTGQPKVSNGAPHPAPVVEVGRNPVGMAYDGATRTIYVTLFRYARAHSRRGPGFRAVGGVLAMVNAATCNASTTAGCAQVRHVPTGGLGPADVAVDDATRTVYVLNGVSQTVAVINTATCNAVTASGCSPRALVRLPSRPSRLAINPRTGTVYVTGFGSQGQLSVINGNTCNASDTSGCGTPPATVSLGPARDLFPSVAVDPATNTVYAGVPGGVAVIDGRTCNATDASGCAKILAVIPGASTAGFAIAGTGSLYVTGGGALVTINQKTCSARDTSACGNPAVIRGGPGPYQMAADQRAGTVYVTNEANAVTMINSATCNAASVSTCADFPPAFPAGNSPAEITVAPALHTLYVVNEQAGTVSIIDAATCNATDRQGCPTKSPAGTPSTLQSACNPVMTAYVSGEPAGPLMRKSVQVAAGSVGGQPWSLWAKKGVIDPYGIEEGGLVLNGRWYALCTEPLSAGPDAGFSLIDAGAQGIVYGFIQHPSRVTIRLGTTGPRWTPYSLLLHGTTFFIAQLPRSACSYHRLALNAWRGKTWGGYSIRNYGSCVPNQIVGIHEGMGTWGPGYRGQHW